YACIVPTNILRLTKKIMYSDDLPHSQIVTPPSVRVKLNPAFIPLELRATSTVKPETCYDKARAMLQLEEVPDHLPCREREYKQIYDKVKSAIEEFSGHRI
ncbi:21775_t:CDS:2, partial [Racocetra persica]